MNVYLIGIGGIGMSALARYYKHAGAFVAGYDLTPTPLTRQLEAEGMAVHYQDNPELIPEVVRQDKAHTLIIYTPAIPAGHAEMNWLVAHDFQIIKRSVALGHIARDHRVLAVAGTHGKTTTSTLLAHILQSEGAGATAFLGGISKNYHSNLLLSHAPALVAEADEYDRSFHQLYPQWVVVTSVDPDHLDIYGSYQAVREAFRVFISHIPAGGALVIKHGVDLRPETDNVSPEAHARANGLQDGDYPIPVGPDVAVYRYDLDTPCDFYARNIRLQADGCGCFDLYLQGQWLLDCRLGIPGRVHVENAVGAAALAYLYGVPLVGIKRALASFQGVKRRMDIQYHSPHCTYIDDYAHHPEEIRATLASLRTWFPEHHITGIFQPHLYTRTRDFAAEFAQTLSLLDAVALLPIYPAREQPIAGITAHTILDHVTTADKQLITPEGVVTYLASRKREVIVTLGAGNIDTLVPVITDYLNSIHA